MRILKRLSAIMEHRHVVALAPLAGFTDHPFRCLALRLGADYAVTEMVSSEALVRRAPKTLHMLNGIRDETMTFVQLVGAREDVMADAAVMAMEAGARGIDINMGCPQKRIVSQGAGAALLRAPRVATRMVKAVVAKVAPLPVTVKMRIGWSREECAEMNRMLKGLVDAGIAMVAIHARTRNQMFSGDPNWQALAKITHGIPVPVIANGSILDRETCQRALAITHAAGVMIGRAALERPWIFQELRGDGHLGQGLSKLEWIRRHQGAILDHLHHILNFYGEDHGLIPLRQHLSWYSKGLHGSARFRRGLYRTDSPLALINDFKKLCNLQ